jgi:hypothetical protein
MDWAIQTSAARLLRIGERDLEGELSPAGFPHCAEVLAAAIELEQARDARPTRIRMLSAALAGKAGGKAVG